ncbi:MAG TPA: hypothetical protein VGC98_16195 [Thermoleophilaceae bacterium]
MTELGHRAREGLSPPGRAAVHVAGVAIGIALAAIAKARGGKAVHPHGVTYRADLSIDRAPVAPLGSELLSTPGTWPAVVRFSRSLGVPRPLPDLLGMSIRVPNRYGEGCDQDFLLVTSVDLPLLHHIFVPAGDVQQRLYSSSLLYRAADRSFLVGARAHPDSPRPDGEDEFDRLARAARTGRLSFDLVIASPFGRFGRVGALQIGSELPATLDALRYSPFNTGGGLEPIGFLNRLRAYAYPLSQRAWGSTGERASAQRRADAELLALGVSE